jgi:hypothetical protein
MLYYNHKPQNIEKMNGDIDNYYEYIYNVWDNEKAVNYAYYIEVIRNYEELLERGYAELDALHFLAQLLPIETGLLLSQGYFQVINN